MAGRGLITQARRAEEVASGLQVFLDELPQCATDITATISELFAISSNFRSLDNAYSDARFQPAFYRIRDDIGSVVSVLNYTLDAALQMFSRSRDAPLKMIWDDLCHLMYEGEGVGFCERLEWCRVFTADLFEVLRGRQPEQLRIIRRRLILLIDAQGASKTTRRPQFIETSSLSTARPRPPRLQSYRAETPLLPSSVSVDWGYSDTRPPVPDPPSAQPPLSPTFTSNSSHTLSSSATSYSGGVPYTPAPYVHWAEKVFNGQNPTTLIDDAGQVERSKCYDVSSPMAFHQLAEDGFVQILELAFDSETVWLRLYWRPIDNRSRALFITTNYRGEQALFCRPLTTLKVIRHGASLQLCHVADPHAPGVLWARLNFVFYERMVLFYNTFLSMKRQDHRPVAHVGLDDIFELREVEEFGGTIRHGEYLHALRIFRDDRSGVLRLEASALRGPMQDVPIWTAFVTKYCGDRDWMQYEGNGIVSLIALKPPPYVFLPDYEPRRARNGEYELNFTTPEDADMFMQNWHALCRPA